MNALTYIYGNPGAVEPVASSSFLRFGRSLWPGRNSDFIWVFLGFLMSAPLGNFLSIDEAQLAGWE